jgi:(S)-citramalyl-CoA lyase
MAVTSQSLQPRRSVLFVSAVDTAAISQGLLSGADVLCLDMEDGVPLSKKEQAREVALQAIAAHNVADGPQLALRINCPRQIDGMRDLLAIAGLSHDVHLLLPKIESEFDVLWVLDVMADAGRQPFLHCIIETGSALEHVHKIAQSSGNVLSLIFGGYDMSAALGVDMEWEPLLYARSRVVHAAASAGLDVWDAPHLDARSDDELRDTTDRSRRFGFTGRICKSPAQIATINQVFTPAIASLERAAKIVAQFEASPYSRLEVDGKVIESPAIRAMKRTLAAAGYSL